jgi:hypothetical protein
MSFLGTILSLSGMDPNGFNMTILLFPELIHSIQFFLPILKKGIKFLYYKEIVPLLLFGSFGIFYPNF